MPIIQQSRAGPGLSDPRPRSAGPRVWHLIWSLDPNHGGTTRCVVEWAKAASDHELTVNVLAGAPAQDVEHFQRFWNELPEHGVGLQISPAATRLGLYRVPAILDRLNAELRSGDLLHLHGVWEQFLWQAAALARSRQVPYVVSPHGMLDRWARARSRWKKQIAWQAGVRKMLAGAAFVHALTEEDRAETQEVLHRSRAQVIPNGIDPAAFDHLPDAGLFFAAYPGFQARRLQVLFLARIHPKKGLDRLIDGFHRVAARSDEISLVIAGPDGDSSYAARCRRQIETGGFQSRICWAGPLDSEEREKALAASTLFALPSHQEGFSMAVLEAMAARLPVLLSPQCRFPAAASAGAGVETANTPEMIANALESLLSLPPSDLRLMGDRARNLVKSDFTLTNTTTLWMQEYQRLAAA